MKVLLGKLKKTVINGSLEYYIVPLYFLCRFIVEIFMGCLRTIKGSINLTKNSGLDKTLPKVLQLPITNKCNLNCKMCNVPSMRHLLDMDLEQFKIALDDKVFCEIESVGINGGEPFLKDNIENYVETLFTLPRLKSIHVISNGILTDRIVEKLKLIYLLCDRRGVSLNITFSIDGYGEIHNRIRGLDHAFEKTINTIKTIQQNKKMYCDTISVICTISKFNIYNLTELDCFFKINNLPPISYQLAIGHKRLNNEKMINDFSIINDKHMKMIAREFFFTKFCETKDKRYYYIYEYISNDFSKRMMSCLWQKDAITIDATGNLCYCATASNQIGSITNSDIYSQIYKETNLMYRKSIIETKCDQCIHYSDSKPYIKTYIQACLFEFKRITWVYKYLRFNR